MTRMGNEGDETWCALSHENADEEMQRFFSAFADRNWATKLSAKDVLHVVSSGGQLGTRALEELGGLKVGQGEQESDNDDALAVEVKNRSDARVLDALLDCTGGSLERLYWDYSAVRAFGIRRIGERCAKLRSFCVRDEWAEFDLASVLRACGRSLRKLELSGRVLRDAYVTAVAVHCGSLQELRLFYEEWEACVIAPWRANGDSLRSVALTCPVALLGGALRDEVIKEICGRCLYLEDLELRYPMYSEFSFAVNLCSSLGERLIKFKMCTAAVFILLDDIKAILNSCPNVLIDADIWHNERPYRMQNTRRLPVCL